MSETETTPTKPLIFADNPFDSARLDDAEHTSQSWDASYVPGYSERKYENEQREARGQKTIGGPRLQWIRISRKGGQDVSAGDEAMVNWLRLGYRAFGLDDLQENGLGMPPSAHVAPDGTIRRGDLALFGVSSERAEINRVEARKRREDALNTSPASDTGEVYSVEEERENRKGSLKEISDIPLPQL